MISLSGLSYHETIQRIMDYSNSKELQDSLVKRHGLIDNESDVQIEKGAYSYLGSADSQATAFCSHLHA